MTNKKKQNTKKMLNYKNEKIEVANELGINGCNETEVNATIASENEAGKSSKTTNKKNNMNNPQKTARQKNYYN